MHHYARLCSLFLVAVLVYTVMVIAVSANALQVASTVTLQDDVEVVEGMVIVADEDSGTYAVSSVASDAQVFGVTAAEPSLVFVTEGNRTPVVTEGISLIRVVGSNGAINRGDLLVSSSIPGVAMLAEEGDPSVFAIALQTHQTQGDGEIGVVQAEIGSERARAAQAMLTGSAQEEEDSRAPSIVRGTIAAVLVVGALFFILYSFRSTMTQGVVSVGRNPKARRSIVTLSFANIGFAVLLCAIVVFIAIAILILPL
jgi:hypothetical protein